MGVQMSKKMAFFIYYSYFILEFGISWIYNRLENIDKEETLMANRIILNETSYFGKGAIQEIPNEIKARGCKKVMVCTDPDLLKFQVATKVTDLLDSAGIDYAVYDGIKANPTIENVQEGVAFCKNEGADVIVAVGGGSAIDTSKAIGIIMTNPEFADVRSLEGASPTKNKCLPIIAVSTTSGTAAEVTINYVITDVATGMDALTHAIEGYITKAAWELTDMMHIKAIEIIAKNLRASVAGDMKAREEMAIGQYIAGMGFSNVGLGIVHSMAHPLSALYDTPHGVACATILPTVMAFNAEATGEKYKDIAIAMGVQGVESMSQEEYRKAAVDAVRQLGIDVGIPQKVSEVGVKAEDIDFLADSALADACTPGNPKDVTKADIVALYESMM